MDIFFYEAFDQEQYQLEKYLPQGIDAGFSWKTIQEIGHKSPPASIISIRTQSQIPLAWADDIKGIITRSTGYDHILSYRKDIGKDMPAGYLPLYCNRSVAEHALMLWMALLRKLPQQQENLKTFRRDGITGSETYQKTLAVFGVGNIGYEIVKIGRGLGMDMLGVDIVKKHDDVYYVDVETAITKADIIVCAMNLTDETTDYFNYSLLSRAKSSAIFINIARGEISPSTELLKLIEDERISGLGLDVYDNEKQLAGILRNKQQPQDSQSLATIKLSEKANVICTPHNAFNTHQAVERKSIDTIKQLEHFRATGQFLWPV